MENVSNAETEEMKRKGRLIDLKKLVELMDSMLSELDKGSISKNLYGVQKLLTLILCKYQSRSSFTCLKNGRHPEQFCFNLLNQIAKDITLPVISLDGNMLKWSEMLLNDSEMTFLHQTSQVDGIDDEYLAEFKVVIRMLSSNTTAEQKIAARFLKRETKVTSEYKILFGKIPNTIAYLIYSLLDGLTIPESSLRKDMVSTLFNVANIAYMDELPFKTTPMIDFAIQKLDGALNANQALTTLTQSIYKAYWWTPEQYSNRQQLFTGFLKLKVLVAMDACSELFLLFSFKKKGREVIKKVAEGVLEAILCSEIEQIDKKSQRPWKADYEVAEESVVSFILNLFFKPGNRIIWLYSIAILDEACKREPSLLEEIAAQKKIIQVLNDVAKSVNEEVRQVSVSLLKKLNLV